MSDGGKRTHRSSGAGLGSLSGLFDPTALVRKAYKSLIWIVLSLLLILPTLAFLAQAFFPRLFNSTTSTGLLSNMTQAFTGSTARGIFDSLMVSSSAAVLGTLIALVLATLIHRTTIVAKRIFNILIWSLLLVPSYLITEGWMRLLEPKGVLSIWGINSNLIYDMFFGPVGVVIVLTTTSIPFGYLVISSGLQGLGSEFEEAGRIHGAGRWRAFAITASLLIPALLSSIAIIFAESMSDFGVASTLAAQANFPVATYNLYSAINSLPLNFGVAAAISWLLVAAAAIPIYVQSKALKGRKLQTLSGRSRRAKLAPLSSRGQILAVGFMVGFFVLSLGIPLLGVFSASLESNFGATFSTHALTFSNYQRVFSFSLFGAPLALSTQLSALTASAACVFGLAIARLITSRSTSFSSKLVDLVLLASLALPGIVLGAGYIFTYNLPVLSNLGVSLYGTTKLLALAYLASALPSTARLLTAPLSQVQSNLSDAARVHGANATSSWISTQLPLLARPILWAWLLTFSKTLLELPISQLLYAPGYVPVSVAINKATAGYDFGGGTAMSVLSLILAFGVIVLALGLFELLAPKGWRRVGKTLNTI